MYSNGQPWVMRREHKYFSVNSLYCWGWQDLNWFPSLIAPWVSYISINHSKLHVTSYVQKSISTIDISAAVSPSWWLLCFIHFSDTSYNTVNFHFKALHKVFLRSEMYWCGMKILICSYILKTNKCLSIPRWWKRVNFDNNWNGR